MIQLTIKNDGTGDELVGNYEFRITTAQEIIKQGKVKHFVRMRGYKDLIKECLGEDKDGED